MVLQHVCCMFRHQWARSSIRWPTTLHLGLPRPPLFHNASHLALSLWRWGGSLSSHPYVPYVAFVIAAFSALRLAKFNLDERQTTSFIGLPTPANALFWAALSVSLSTNGYLVSDNALWLLPALVVGTLLSSWLLVAEIPMFALKFKHYGVRGNELRYGLYYSAYCCLPFWAG